MIVGIIGNGADKFTPETTVLAKNTIHQIFAESMFKVLSSAAGPREVILVSGHSPLGGVDIWAEEIAGELGLPMDIKTPKTHSWAGDYGYKARNLDIARTAHVVHVIVARSYPPDYRGRRFRFCYHCQQDDHIKSGACYTAKKAIEMGKQAIWHLV